MDSGVPIAPAELMVASGRDRGKDAVLSHMDKCHIKSSAAQIINENVGVLSPVVQSICHSCGIRFVNDFLDFESCSLCRTDGRLAFLGIKIGGNRYNGVFNGVADSSLCFLFQVPQQKRRQVLGCIGFAVNVAIWFFLAHLPLEGRNTVFLAGVIGIFRLTAENDLAIEELNDRGG